MIAIQLAIIFLFAWYPGYCAEPVAAFDGNRNLHNNFKYLNILCRVRRDKKMCRKVIQIKIKLNWRMDYSK